MGKYQFKSEPYAHQRKALTTRGAWKRPYFWWRMEMGTGKTKVALDNAGILYGEGLIDGLLIIAPKTICRNWGQVEIPKHLPDSIKRRILLWRPPSNRTREWKQRYADLMKCDGLAIFIVNVEAFSRKTGFEGTEPFLKRRRAMVVLDESSKIKNRKANRTKEIIKVGRRAEYRRAMTGSPLLPNDLFSQGNFLTPGAYGHTSFASFQAHYRVMEEIYVGKDEKRDVPVGYKNLDELGQRTARFSYHVTKAECLDLPPKVYVEREVEMTREQIKHYETMREEFVATVLEGEVRASIVLAQMVRLQQILLGYLKIDTGEVIDLPENRTDALLEVLEETSGSAIIWAPDRISQAKLYRAVERAGRRPVIVNGSTKEAQRAEYVDQFQAGDIDTWIGGTDVGGMGLTLTRAELVMYWCNKWSIDDRMQSEDRAHRIGLKHSVTYVDLLVPDTVDTKIHTALRENLSLADALAKASREEVAGWL